MTYAEQFTTERMANAASPSQLAVQQLEQLWLLSALGVGFDQMAHGEVVLADTDFFNALQGRLFQQEPERIIEA